MKLIIALLILGCIVSLSHGQWVEKVIPLPDSLSGLDGIGAIQFHSPNHAMYVGGQGKLIVVDAATREKLSRVNLPGWVDIMCSNTVSNKLYCASRSGQSIYVVDCAANHYVKAVQLNGDPREMCYAAAENKVYFAIPSSNSVQVLDCGSDSIVATLSSLPSASAVCYNPVLNRVYSAQSASDEVAVIDCATDSVIRAIWVRGVEPMGICFDSATNCVYTANHTSGTSSVIDCAGDSVVRIVSVGDSPWDLLVGPQGKVYCGGDNSVLTVIDGSETRTIPVGANLWRWSYDPANRKVYHSSWNSNTVTVVDAVGDSVLVRLEVDEATSSLCYDPLGNGTWAGGEDGAGIRIVDGETDRLTAMIPVGAFHPGALRYDPLNNHLYCLAEVWGTYTDYGYLLVIDGDSNRVLKVQPAEGAGDSMLWNPVNNKLYISNSGDNTVSIVDCTSDSVVATINSREDWPDASCCSDDGKVYVCNDGYGVTVIDPVGDSVRKVIEVGHNPWGICYDRTDNTVYIGKWNGGPVRVIDVNTDTVVDSIAVGFPYQSVSWNKSHNKVYVSSFDDPHVAVIDCAADTVLKTIATASAGFATAYCDSVTDRVYLADVDGTTLRILDAKTDSLYKSLNAGSVGAMADNGRPGATHRLYSTGYYLSSEVAVVGGETDSVLRRIQVGDEPFALAWNPVHSWMYVSNAGSSSVTVLRDTLLAGVEEGQTQAPSRKLQATIVRGVLNLAPAAGHKLQAASLLDISGRKVLDLHPGANDVSRLAPGVYFVREVQAQAQAQLVRRVVILK